MIDRLSLPLVSPAGMLRFGPPGSEVLTDFRVIAKLGEGPLGVVYRAHQVSQSREVVLKILAPRAAADAKVLERFLHEARTALTMDHPSLVRGLGVGEEHGLHYLALESLNGESVERCLSQVGQFSVGDTVRVVRDVGRGLQYAHARNIRHRDIRTSNIVVTRDGEVVLTDLGFAKILAERIEVTTRDEVNALGAILYELLTGKRPFAAETVYEALTAPALPPYEPVYRLNPKVPNTIDQLVPRPNPALPGRRRAGGGAGSHRAGQRDARDHSVRCQPQGRAGGHPAASPAGGSADLPETASEPGAPSNLRPGRGGWCRRAGHHCGRRLLAVPRDRPAVRHSRRAGGAGGQRATHRWRARGRDPGPGRDPGDERRQ